MGFLGQANIEKDVRRLWPFFGMQQQTLVDVQIMATVGGRILVASSSHLTATCSTGATTISTLHDFAAIGDIVYLEARGAIEYMRIEAGPTGTGPYEYTVTRNLDGSGANEWVANDAIVNTGQTGDGLLELFQATGLQGGNGPAATVWARSSANWNALTAVAQMGNLLGTRGYSASTWGAWFGRYGSGYTWLSIDDSNGIRVMNYQTQVFRVDTGGSVYVGNPLDWNTFIYAGGLQIRYGSAVYLAAAGGVLTLGTGTAGAAVLSFASGTIYCYKVLIQDPLTLQTLFTIAGTEFNLDTGDFVIANTGALRIHTTAVLTGDGVWASYNAGAPVLRVGTVSGGALVKGVYWNGSALQIKSNRMTLDDIGGVYSIGGWTFDLYTFYSFTGKVMLESLYGRISLNDQAGLDGDGATWRIWAGSTWANRATAPFRVDKDGNLYASTATLNGTVTIASGAKVTSGDGTCWLEYTGLRLDANAGGYNNIRWQNGATVVAEIGGSLSSGQGYLANYALGSSKGFWFASAKETTNGYETILQLSSGGSDATRFCAVVFGAVDGLMIQRSGSVALIGVGMLTPSSTLDVNGDAEILSTAAYYLGDPVTDGSWRFVRSGNDLLAQRRESGSWVTKQTIAA
jgi:hypothetical protein